MVPTFRERLRVVYERLDAAAPARTADQALELLSRTLAAVEDELSGVPQEADPGYDTKGRMYPPAPRYITRHPDGSLTAKQKRHIVFCGADGSIQVRLKTGEVEFAKPGGAE